MKLKFIKEVKHLPLDLDLVMEDDLTNDTTELNKTTKTNKVVKKNDTNKTNKTSMKIKLSEAIKLIESKTGKKAILQDIPKSNFKLLESKLQLKEGVFDKMPKNFVQKVIRDSAGEKSKLVKLQASFTNKTKLYNLLKDEKSKYIAFLGKVNDGWCFMISIDKNASKGQYRLYIANDLIELLTSGYGENGYQEFEKDNFNKKSHKSQIDKYGQVSIKNYKHIRSGSGWRQSGYYSSTELSFDNLWANIPQGEGIDLYGISVDSNRQEIQKDRALNKKTVENEGVSSDTIKKYIKQKFFDTKLLDELKNEFTKVSADIMKSDDPQVMLHLYIQI